MIFRRRDGQSSQGPQEGAPETERLLREGLSLHRTGNKQAAEQAYRKVLEHDPASAPATHFMGMLAHQAGRSQEALSLIRESVARSPKTASFHSNLGVVCGQMGMTEEAVAAFRSALRLDPKSFDAHKNLGIALETLNRFEEAATEYSAALRISAGAADVEAHLARATARSGSLPEPADLPGIEGGEASALTLRSLAAEYERQGRLEGAISARRRLLAIQPESASAHSALLYMLLHSASVTRAESFREHLQWAERHAPPVRADAFSHRRNQSTGRPLRVGYVSPSLRRHVSARFIEPLISARDRRQFVAICYSDCPQPDNVTRRIRTMADEWRDTSALNTSQVCALIEHDQIDILVDCCGHMGGNRMPVFAARAAPVQVTYLYPHTTGLRTMDAHLSDVWAHPIGLSDRFHTERVIRVPRTGWCCLPPEDAPPVSGLPALATGTIMFGCLNRLLKVTTYMLDTWAQLLASLPKSRLLLLTESQESAVHVRREFARQGVTEDRVIAVLRGSHRSYLEQTRRIDIALDTFPYNGQTTSYDMLWMGLPVVTMAGDSPASRMGLGLLSNLGLTDLVARTPGEYVRIATNLAADLDRLRDLRQSLRERLQCSALMDERATTSRIESAFQTLWEDWCERRTTPPSG